MEKLVMQKIKNLTILYVEDEDNIREKIADTLRYYVKEVIEAKDGEEGFKKYSTHKPDIILSDILMPHLDGISMVKRIRQTDMKTPISLITAHTNKDMLLDAVKLRLEDYLVKPVTFDDILNILVTSCSKLPSTSCRLSNDLVYEEKNKTLYKGEKQIKLTKKESVFFELLINHEENIVSYDALQVHVWGDEVMTDNALRSLVHSLRQKIGKNSIKNLSGFGYKLEFS